MADARILICDDHEIVREALRARIEATPGFEVAGEAGDGKSVVNQVRGLRPDLLIIDLELPESDGISASIRILELWPDQKILVFTAHDQESVTDLVTQAGVAGCISKSASTAELAEACRRVLDGETVFPGHAKGGGRAGFDLERLRSLSERERQILKLLADGMRAREIATETGLRKSTVYTHVRNVVSKLGVETRAQAVALAIRYSFLYPVGKKRRVVSSPRGTPANNR